MNRIALSMTLFFGCTGVALADLTDGCVNSPEGPTLVLAMLGIAAAGVRRLRRHRQEMRAAAAAV